MTFRGRKSDAEEALRRYLAGLEAGGEDPLISRGDGRIPLAQFGRDVIEGKRGVRSDDTLDTDLSRWNLHIAPLVGDLSVTRVTIRHVEDSLKAWRTAKRHDRKKGALSDRTIWHLFSLLRSILNVAVRKGLIQQNPCDVVEVPSKGHTEVKALDLQTAIAVLDGLRGHDLHAPAVIAAMTGLRRGEMLGWQWSDVDLDRGIATVQRALTERRLRDEAGDLHHHIKTKGPKRPSSRRPVALTAQVVKVLRSHRATQAETARRFGWKVSDETHVFTDVSAGVKLTHPAG